MFCLLRGCRRGDLHKVPPGLAASAMDGGRRAVTPLARTDQANRQEGVLLDVVPVVQ